MTQSYSWSRKPDPENARPFSGLFSSDGDIMHVCDYLAKHYGTEFVESLPAAVHEFYGMVFMGYPEAEINLLLQAHYSVVPIAEQTGG